MIYRGFLGAVLLSAALANGLSIHDDLHATPHFPVSVESEFVYREDVEDIINRVLPIPKAYPAGVEYTYEIMKLGSRQQARGGSDGVDGEFDFLCALPDNEPFSKVDQTATIDEVALQQEAKEQALALLEELKGKCFYYIYGYWTYSYCYPYKMTQFRQLDRKGAIMFPPSPDPNQFFTLGSNRPSGETEPEFLRAVISRRPDELSEGEIKLLNNIESDMYIDARGDTKYLVQKINYGSRCDITGLNRTTEIQFSCDSTVPAGQARINWITEFKTCRYMVGIGSSSLCESEFFQPSRADDERTTMKCFPIVDEQDAERQKVIYGELSEIIYAGPKNRTHVSQKDIIEEEVIIIEDTEEPLAVDVIDLVKQLLEQHGIEIPEDIIMPFSAPAAKEAQEDENTGNNNAESSTEEIKAESAEETNNMDDLMGKFFQNMLGQMMNKVSDDFRAQHGLDDEPLVEEGAPSGGEGHNEDNTGSNDGRLENSDENHDFMAEMMDEIFGTGFGSLMLQASKNYQDYKEKFPDGEENVESQAPDEVTSEPTHDEL